MLVVYPLFLAALLLWTPVLFAQAFDVRNLEFERLTIDNGLSQNFVACIAQDRQGFLWFGTRDGLNRYDGYHFKVYSHNAIDLTSLSANDIRAIYEDRQGNLWIGTFAGGLNRYDRANDRFIRYQHDPKNPHSLSHNHVQVILEDSRHGGTLWIGTTGGLNRFDPNTQRFTRYFCQPDDTTSRGHNDISAIFQDQTGNLWLGLSHPSSGLLFFDRSTESFTAFEVDPAIPIRTIPSVLFTRMRAAIFGRALSPDCFA
jgi:ligand-binding sensor domain-containing protein